MGGEDCAFPLYFFEYVLMGGNSIVFTVALCQRSFLLLQCLGQHYAGQVVCEVHGVLVVRYVVFDARPVVLGVGKNFSFLSSNLLLIESLISTLILICILLNHRRDGCSHKLGLLVVRSQIILIILFDLYRKVKLTAAICGDR